MAPTNHTHWFGQSEAVLSEQKQSKPGFWQIVLSVLAAALGVNSRRNQERDFQSSTPMPFIVGGVIFGVIFVVTIVLIVMLVLESTGAG